MIDWKNINDNVLSMEELFRILTDWSNIVGQGKGQHASKGKSEGEFVHFEFLRVFSKS